MNYLSLRAWFLVTLALALGAVIARLVWEIPYTTTVPSLKKVESLAVRIGVTVIVTAAIIGAIVHFICFVPSPEAAPLSIIIASLLLMGGISAYLLVLWVIWKKWQRHLALLP